MLKDKLIAVLSVYGSDDVDDISITDENIVVVDGDEFKVLDDDEADEEFRQYQQNLWDDCGINSFTDWARDYILSNFVDEDWFEEVMRESYQWYVDDIKNEGNRLQEEMEEHGVETEEEYIDCLCEAYDNGVDWYRQNFGDEDFSKVVEQKDLIDFDKVIEWLKDTDGRGCIASYDGDEQEANGYYVYQIG
jgi:hypothetical protein